MILRSPGKTESLGNRVKVEVVNILRLKKDSRPVVYPANTSVTAYTGQRLDISVEFCANPPSTKRFWITETQRLAPGQTTSDFIAHNVTTKGDSIIKNWSYNQNQLIAYHTPNQLGESPVKKFRYW
ncbi:hypothetical protein RUM44_007350 [Polyplax serrata]|uniref:Uncharacterized protein n=1 Tax=Polyplax serrata TaxID=468196 RepID=A0ABR1B0W9_POLSC